MTTPRPLVRPARVLAAALAAGTLFATAACSGSDSSASPEADASSTVAERGVAAQTTSPSASSPSASASPSDLSEEGARNALITPADIEDDWTQVRDPSEWRDSLLVGSVDVAAFVDGRSDTQDCQRLVDALFDETLLGKPTGRVRRHRLPAGRLPAAVPGRRVRQGGPGRLHAVADGSRAPTRPGRRRP
ncbi:hypothetical protein SALBM217S_08703 [Streptomyces griseoloalbus]